MSAPAARPSAYLSAREAARRLGVSDKTVRTWVRTGRLPAEQSAQGFRIPADRVDELAAARSAEVPADAARPSADSPQPADHVTDLRAYVADLRDQLEVKDRQISELHTLLAQAQRALPIPSEIAPQRDSEHATSQSTEAPSETREARPWWQFWR